jgi:hypothetical protein
MSHPRVPIGLTIPAELKAAADALVPRGRFSRVVEAGLLDQLAKLATERLAAEQSEAGR